VRYEPIDPQLFIKNRERLRGLLKPDSIVIVHANDIYPTNADGTMVFRQQNDLYYLTGIAQEETVLILMPDAYEERDREILFVKETSEEIAIWEGEKLTKAQASAVSGISRVEWVSSFESFLHRLVPQKDNIYLATNEHLRAVVEVETRNARFIKECQQRYPLHHYERLAPLMHRLRRRSGLSRKRATSPRRDSAVRWALSNPAWGSGRSRRNSCTSSCAAVPVDSPTPRSSAAARTPASCITSRTIIFAGKATCC
jgi:hypothetical protein